MGDEAGWWDGRRPVMVMVMVVTVVAVTLGRLFSRFSMTASPRSLRRPRVASARRNRICTQAAGSLARGCGAPRAGHAPL